MADKTGIEWTRGEDGSPGATWNPIAGCSLKSPGCTNCYAMPTARRHELMSAAQDRVSPYAGLTKVVNGKTVWTGEMRLVEAALTLPLRWTKPRRIFVNSMSDLFHESVPDAWIDRVFAVMALAPQHTFQVLTKRADRMRAYLSSDETSGRLTRALSHGLDGIGSITIKSRDDGRSGISLPNVWLGVSTEDQRRADERVPDLLATPAAVRFVSAEPLLGPIDFRGFIRPRSGAGLRPWSTFEWPSWVPNDVRRQVEDFWSEKHGRGPCSWMENAVHNGQPALGVRGRYLLCRAGEHYVEGRFVPAWNNMGRVVDDAGIAHVVSAGLWSGSTYLDWIIVGGESGPGARPMHPDWARQIRDACTAAGVAFHFKQWGAWGAINQSEGADQAGWDGRGEWMILSADGDMDIPDGRWPDEEAKEVAIVRVGKRTAGRLLDGVEHSGFPEIR